MLPPNMQGDPPMNWLGRISVMTVAAALGAAVLHGQASRSTATALPDWSGVWAMQGGTVFDRATIKPPNAGVNSPDAREFPPYNAEWEAKYAANLKRVAAGTFPDPISTCGTP